MTNEVYFLSSLDSARFEPVRECGFGRPLTFDSGKIAIEAAISPGVIGQDFGHFADIDKVIMTPRHEGVSLLPVSEFPCFVFIALSIADFVLESPIRPDDLEIIGWGELYRTRDDAARHTFRPA